MHTQYIEYWYSISLKLLFYSGIKCESTDFVHTCTNLIQNSKCLPVVKTSQTLIPARITHTSRCYWWPAHIWLHLTSSTRFHWVSSSPGVPRLFSPQTGARLETPIISRGSRISQRILIWASVKNNNLHARFLWCCNHLRGCVGTEKVLRLRTYSFIFVVLI